MKLKMFILAGMGLIALATGCQYPQTCRLEALKEKVLVLEQELSELKNEQTDTLSLEEVFDGTTVKGGTVPVRWMVRYLELIAPPDNPSPQQVRKYLTRLASLRNSNIDYYTHARAMIAAQLNSFGHEYLAEILPYVASQYYRNAVAGLIRPEDKEMLRGIAMRQGEGGSHAAAEFFLNLADKSDKNTVLVLLKSHSTAINAVVRLGIEKEALPTIEQKLISDGHFWDYEQWFDVAMNNLDEEQRQTLIRKIWRNLRMDPGRDQWRTWDYAWKLAGHGCIDAFKYTLENKNIYKHDTNKQRQLLCLADVSEYKELENWYQENKNNLVFDSGKGIFTTTAK